MQRVLTAEFADFLCEILDLYEVVCDLWHAGALRLAALFDLRVSAERHLVVVAGVVVLRVGGLQRGVRHQVNLREKERGRES